MQLSSANIIIDGDVERRIIRVWTPDFYKDDPSLQSINDLVRTAAALLDYMLEKARGLPSLVNIDTCPPDVLPFLGALVGYEWKPTISPEAQRQELRKIVDVYLIRGTPASIVRIVLNAGAKTGRVFTPAEHIFTYDQSKWDNGDRYEDPDFWRWGTYEVIADKDFRHFHDDIEGVHPAGTRWFGRQLIPLENDHPGDPDTEIPQNTLVAHVYHDDYREPAGLAYDGTVLADSPAGFWKLEEPVKADFAAHGSGALYGTAIYGESLYDGTAALIAADASPNGNHGVYNSETEIVAYGDAVQQVFPLIQLSISPALPGSIRLTFDSKTAEDDGAGKITGAATGTVDYDLAQLKDLTLDAPLGAGASSMPVASGQQTLTFFDSLQLRVASHQITGYNDGDTVTGFTEASPAALALTCPVGNQPTFETDEINGFPVLRLTNDKISLPSELDLGVNHFLIFAFKASAWQATTNKFTDTDTATTSIQYANNTNQLKYIIAGETLTFPARALSTGEWYVIAFHRIGQNVELYINGSLVSTQTLVTNPTVSLKIKTLFNNTSGSPTTGPSGDTPTLFAYNNSFTNARKREILRYVGAKYALYRGVVYEIDPTLIAGVDGDRVGKFTDALGNLFTVGPDYLPSAGVATRWHKGDTLIQGGETPVDSWPLSSNSGLGALAQVTVGLQPKFKANRLNGIGTVAFDGVDDSLNIASAEGYGTQQTFTMLVRFSDVSVSQRIGGTNGTTHGIRYNAPADGGPSITYIANGTSATWNFTFQANRWYCIQFHRNGTSNILYVDGVPQGSQAQGSGSVSHIQVGTYGSPGSQYFRGEIAEWIAQGSTAPSVENTLGMLDALALKWAWMTPPRAPTLQVNEVNGQATLRGFFDPSNENGAAMSLLAAKDLHFGSTLSFVFRVSNFAAYVSANDTMVLCSGKGSGNSSYLVYNPAGLGTITYATETGSVAVSKKLTEGETHVITVRRRRALVEFYVDGLLAGSGNLSGSADGAFHFRTIMAFTPVAGSAGTHFADDFAYGLVCDVAIDDDEIMALHQYEATRFAAPYKSPASFPMRVFYNDYVERGMPGPIVGIDSHAGRFGLRPRVVNKGYVRIPAVTSLNPGLGSYTIEAWIKQSSSNGGTIFGTTWTSGGLPMELRLSVDRVDNKVEFSLKNGVKNYLLRGMEQIGDDQWHLIQVVIDYTAKRIYLRIDFRLVDADDYDIVTTLLPTDDYYIGVLHPSLADPAYYRGTIGRVAVFKSAVPSARLALHYARGFGGMAVDDSIVTYIVDNDEPLGSFGVRAFSLDESSLDGPDILDGETVTSVITGETWRYVLNPVGVADKLLIRDRIQTDKNQIVDKLVVVDKVTLRVERRVLIVDKLVISDSATTGPA